MEQDATAQSVAANDSTLCSSLATQLKSAATNAVGGGAESAGPSVCAVWRVSTRNTVRSPYSGRTGLGAVAASGVWPISIARRVKAAQ